MRAQTDRLRAALLPAVRAGLLGLAWCAAANVVGDVWWFWDLFSHFARIWYWAAVALFAAAFLLGAVAETLAAAAVAAWFAWWLRLADAAPGAWPLDPAQLAAMAAALGALVLPGLPKSRRGILGLCLALASVAGGLGQGWAQSDGRAVMRFSNALYWNADPAAVARELGRPAELAAAVEESPALSAALESGSGTCAAFLGGAREPRPFADRQRAAGLAAASYGLYACEPFAQKETLTLGGYPVGHAVTRAGLHAYVAHPFPPFGPEAFARQKEVFAGLAERLAAHDAAGEKFLLVGDFNSTVFSPTFRRTLGKWALRPAYSWNVGSPLSMPIDYAVTNLDAFAAYGPVTSSDHVPVAVFANAKGPR